jgi:hypothetical protein
VRWEAELFVTTSYFYLGRFMRRARSYKTDQDLGNVVCVPPPDAR